ncbi:MAG TPA: hypothetical protein PKD53_00810 [Chloroflexaceae bacterium]|nr:hypothetical protein [Chloroflexaceae bacterium]
MGMDRFVRLIVALVIAVGLIAVAAPRAFAQEANVEPDAAPANTRFAFFADGFAPNESVTVQLVGADGQARAAAIEELGTANAAGRADWFWKAPLDSPPGGYAMLARGDASGYEQRIPFAITADDPEPPVVNVEPNLGPGGTRFAFFARNYEANERISVRLLGPDGNGVAANVENLNRANPQGRADWYWQSPANIAPGTYTLIARGETTGSERAILFAITARAPVAAAANVEPRSATGGTRFAFFVEGLAPNEQVLVWVNTPDRRAVEARVEELGRTDASGRADWFWTAPVDAAPGTWVMVARGQASQVERSFPIEILPSALVASAEPGAGPGGTRFAFAANGFAPGEQILLWANSPDRRALPVQGEELGAADANGRADWFWTAPEDAAPGAWVMVARGRTSQAERVITFEVRP